MIENIVRESEDRKGEDKDDGNHGNLSPGDRDAQRRTTTDFLKSL